MGAPPPAARAERRGQPANADFSVAGASAGRADGKQRGSTLGTCCPGGLDFSGGRLRQRRRVNHGEHGEHGGSRALSRHLGDYRPDSLRDLCALRGKILRVRASPARRRDVPSALDPPGRCASGRGPAPSPSQAGSRAPAFPGPWEWAAVLGIDAVASVGSGRTLHRFARARPALTGRTAWCSRSAFGRREHNAVLATHRPVATLAQNRSSP